MLISICNYSKTKNFTYSIFWYEAHQGWAGFQHWQLGMPLAR